MNGYNILVTARHRVQLQRCCQKIVGNSVRVRFNYTPVLIGENCNECLREISIFVPCAEKFEAGQFLTIADENGISRAVAALQWWMGGNLPVQNNSSAELSS